MSAHAAGRQCTAGPTLHCAWLTSAYAVACFVLCAQNGMSAPNGTNGMSAQLNGLNAAALALQALAAANPALLLNQNPWLAQHMQLLNGMPGQAGQGGAAMAQNAFAAHMQAQQQGAMPAMEAAQFAAHQLAGQHLNGAAGECLRIPLAGRAVVAGHWWFVMFVLQGHSPKQTWLACCASCSLCLVLSALVLVVLWRG